jgi:hypothetical protein
MTTTTDALAAKISAFNTLNLRAGAWGDPANVPVHVWRALYGDSIEGTGYTNLWRTCGPEYSQWFMASVRSISEAAEAHAMGWRTYRVDLEGVGATEGEIICPEQKVNGVATGVTCDTCRLCGGQRRKGAKNIVIAPIVRGDNDAQCYVNVSWLGKMFAKWARGDTPIVAPDIMGAYLHGAIAGDYSTVEVWRGPSPLNGDAIVMLMTGLGRPSQNSKTGPMVQTYIIPQAMAPILAVRSGADESVCGTCPMRPIYAA